MQIEIPEFTDVILGILEVESNFDGKTNKIEKWIELQKSKIIRNRELIEKGDESSDLEILKIFFTDMLVRAMTGESGQRLKKGMGEWIKNYDDLKDGTLKGVLEKSSYRWGEKIGLETLKGIVECFENHHTKDWRRYFQEVDEYWKTNYLADQFLKVKGVHFKVRDLTLTNFSEMYIAIDLHVARVATRTGLLNHGFHLCDDEKIEMGNNPANDKNYLFLHRLFHFFSEQSKGEFKPVAIDRAFWHFGRTICDAKPKCEICPIQKKCLTGRQRV